MVHTLIERNVGVLVKPLIAEQLQFLVYLCMTSLITFCDRWNITSLMMDLLGLPRWA